MINEIFALEQFDNAKLAKYVRCIFQAILPLDETLALQLVHQATQIAREGSQVSPSMLPTFPLFHSLEWFLMPHDACNLQSRVINGMAS